MYINIYIYSFSVFFFSLYLYIYIFFYIFFFLYISFFALFLFFLLLFFSTIFFSYLKLFLFLAFAHSRFLQAGIPPLPPNNKGGKNGTAFWHYAVENGTRASLAVCLGGGGEEELP